MESLGQSHRIVPALGFKRRIHENRILSQRFLGECATLAVIRCVPDPDVGFHCSSSCRHRQPSLTCCVNSNQFIEPLFWLKGRSSALGTSTDTRLGVVQSAPKGRAILNCPTACENSRWQLSKMSERDPKSGGGAAPHRARR